jgi:hypothetical protein
MLGCVDEQRFFVVKGFANAAYGVAVVLVAFGGASLFLALGGGLAVPLAAACFAIAFLIFGVARFSARTPVIVVRASEVVVRAAMLAPEQVVPMTSLRGFKHEGGYVVLTRKEGADLKVPMTSFTKDDARSLLAALDARLPRITH